MLFLYLQHHRIYQELQSNRRLIFQILAMTNANVMISGGSNRTGVAASSISGQRKYFAAGKRRAFASLVAGGASIDVAIKWR